MSWLFLCLLAKIYDATNASGLELIILYEYQYNAKATIQSDMM